MSDIDLSLTPGAADGVDRIISSLERLHSTMEKLGSSGNGALSRMADQMEKLQMSMTTGFREMAELAKSGMVKVGNEQVAAITANGARAEAALKEAGLKIQTANAATWEQLQRGASSNVAKAFNQLAQGVPVELVTKRLGDLAANTAASFEGQIEKLKQFQANTQSLYTTHYKTLAGATEAEMAQARQMDDQFNAKRTTAMAAAREKDLALQNAFDKAQADLANKHEAARILDLERERQIEEKWTKMLEEEGAKRVAAAASLAEKQRVLNTNFNTASPASQLNTARQAAEYGRQGGDVEARYGSAAASADIRALTEAHARLQPAVAGSTRAIETSGHAMNEAHSLARGLAGSLGGLWLTYGSVVPLLAGAAIAGSLKNIVSVGKEVEYQLSFVQALTGTGVNLSQFLTITDSSLHSITEASNAMRMLAQNGLTSAQSLQVLPDILNLATVGEMTVGQAALAATGTVSAFGLSISEVGRVSDIFAKTAASSNTSVVEITESMKQASTVASLFKVSIEETAGVLGLLAKINITGGAAGTSMTNMLNGLYEPTEKGKKALKELGVETQTASGAIKPFTQVMEEMRGALSRFNDSAKVDILGSIFTVRGVKAVQLVQENLRDFKKNVDDAATSAGFMREVMVGLEDNTSGAFKRLAVTVEKTFVKAFSDAQPYVQALGLKMADMFGDKGVQSSIGNFATNIARLTGALLDNGVAVAALTVGYVGLRMLSPVIALFQAATAASTALGVAQAAATAASVAHTAAMAGGASTVALFTAATETQTAATAAATAASAAWGAVLLPALAAVAIAVAAGAALWLLFRDNTDEADKSNQRISNSLHVIDDQLQKEIESLTKSNKLWDERLGKFRDQGGVSPDLILEAQSQVTKIEERIRASGSDPDKVRNSETVIDAGTGMSSQTYYHSLADALAKADSNLEKLQRTDRDFREKLEPQRAFAKTKSFSEALGKDLGSLADRGEERGSNGEFYIKDERVRSLAARAKDIDAERTNPEKIMKDQEAEHKRLEILRTDYKSLTDQINAMQSSRAAKPPKGAAAAANDALNAKLKELDLARQLAQLDSQGAISDARAQNRRGELGDLGLINVELAQKIALHKQEVETARQQYEVAEGGKNKRAKKQEYENRGVLAKRAEEIDITSAAEARKTVMERMAQEEQKYNAQTLAAQGKNKEAFLAGYEADYRTTINRITADMESSQDEGEQRQLQSYLNFLGKLREAGAQAGLYKDVENAFNATLEGMHQRLDDLARDSGPGAGLSAIFDNARLAAEAYESNLPTLIEQQTKLAAIANSTDGTDAQKKDAASKLRAIQSEAAAMRNVWVDVSKTIGTELEKAFGRGGKAIGGLLTASLTYGARQQKINDDFAASKKDEEAINKRQLDTQSAQISAYGEMAGAASGFFGENTKGYQAMMAVSRVFHAAELAMTVARLVPMAIAAVLNQGSGGDPYTAFGRMAAMAAIVTGLGVAVSAGGSKGGTTASEQQSRGSGTVFGDSGTKNADGIMIYKQQSESLTRGLALVEKNTYQNLQIGSEMLQSLRHIEASMTGLANMVVRSGAVDGKNFNIKEGTISSPSKGGFVAAGAAAGAILGPMGAVIGAIGGAVVGLVASLWGKTKQNVIDSGIKFGGNIRDLQAGKGYDQYASVDTTKSSWFGLSKKTTNSVQTAALDGGLSSQFGMIFTDFEKSLSLAAEAVGGTADQVSKALDNLTLSDNTASLKGLTGDALTTALNNMISKALDEMAQAALPAFEQFRKVGEGYAETVLRVAADYQAIDTVFKSFGKTFGMVGMASLAARERLVEMSGGLEKFTSQGAFFLEHFFSDAEKRTALSNQLSPELVKAGLSADSSRDTFKDLILSLDTTTEAGAKTYTSLMLLAPAFDTLQQALERLAKDRSGLEIQVMELEGNAAGALAAKRRDELKALDASLRPIQERIYALQDEKDAVEAAKAAASTMVDNALAGVQRAVEAEKKRVTTLHDLQMKAMQAQIDSTTEALTKHKSLADALKSAIDQIKTPDITLAGRDQARATLDNATATARATGELPTAESMKDPLAVLTKDSSSLFSSFEDFQRDSYKSANSISNLGDVVNAQVSVEQQILDTLNEQKTASQTAFDMEIARLDSVYENAKAQVDALHGIDNSVMSVSDALDRLASALNVAKAAGVGSAAGAGVSGSSYGVASGGNGYWNYSASQGWVMTSERNGGYGSTSDMKFLPELKSMLALDKGLSSMPSFAVGTDFVPNDMIASIHKGERIIPAADNAQLMRSLDGGGGNDQLVAELRASREENARTAAMLEAHLYAIAKYTQDTRDIQDTWDGAGLPTTRSA